MNFNRCLLFMLLSFFLLVFTGCGEDKTIYEDATGTTPAAFTFTNLTDVALGATATSNAITVSGITAASPISVTGGSYSIGTGAFTTSAGTVTNGQTVRVQHTASASGSTATTTTLTIGGVSAKFTSTTVAGTTAPGDTSAGQALFANKCGSCHTATSSYVYHASAATLIAATNMRMGLTDAQLQQIADYLATK